MHEQRRCDAATPRIPRLCEHGHAALYAAAVHAAARSRDEQCVRLLPRGGVTTARHRCLELYPDAEPPPRRRIRSSRKRARVLPRLSWPAREVHERVARALENFFATVQTSVVELRTRQDLINRLVYVATNPVKDGLVARVADYPGASGYQALLTGVPLRATRPKHFFAKDGDMPEEVTLHVRIPPSSATMTRSSPRSKSASPRSSARRRSDGPQPGSA